MQRDRAIQRDDFNRPDGDPGAPWEAADGTMVLDGGQIAPFGGPATWRYDSPLSDVDHWAAAVLGNDVSSDREVYVRMNDAGAHSGYAVVCNRFALVKTLFLSKVVDGAFSELSSVDLPVGFTTGDRMIIEVRGPIIRGLLNNVEHIRVTDETFAANVRSGVGIGSGVLGRLDDWEAGLFNYPPPTPTVLYAEPTSASSFSYATSAVTAAAGEQVQIWVEHSGGLADATSVAGASITGATKIATTVFNSGNQKLEMWVALGTGTAGAITVTWSEEQFAGVLLVVEVANVAVASGTHGIRQSSVNTGGPSNGMNATTLLPFSSDFNPAFWGSGNNQSNTMFAKEGSIVLAARDHEGPAGGAAVLWTPWQQRIPETVGAGDEAPWGFIAVEVVALPDAHEGTVEESFPQFGETADIWREIPIEIVGTEDLGIQVEEAAAGKARFDLFPAFGESALAESALPTLEGGQFGPLLVFGDAPVVPVAVTLAAATEFSPFADTADALLVPPFTDFAAAEMFPGLTDAAALTNAMDVSIIETFPQFADSAVLFQGFEWPNAANTGPRIALTPFVGNFTTSSNGQTVSGLAITGTLTINHTNVVVQDCSVAGSAIFCVRVSSTNALIEHCYIGRADHLGGDDGIIYPTGGTYTVQHCEFEGTVDFVKLGNGPATVQYNYMHGLNLTSPGAHNDGIQINTGNHVAIRDNMVQHNWVDATGASTACFFGADDWHGTTTLNHNYWTGLSSGSNKASRIWGLHESGHYVVTNNFIENNTWDAGPILFGKAVSASGTEPVIDTWTNNVLVSGGPTGTFVGTIPQVTHNV